MGACDCCDLVDDGAGIFKPLRSRWCTDIFCLAFFLVYTAAMITIGSIALSSGNINCECGRDVERDAGNAS